MLRNAKFTGTEFVLNLQPDLDLSFVGAKAANLGKAIELGVRVPTGLAITQQALILFLEQTDLLPKVQQLIDNYELDDKMRAADYEALRQEVLKTPIPQPVAKAVTPIAQILLGASSHGLAVRSSGVHEDSAKASFAGVYESVLCVSSLDDVLDSIKKCWCSSWAPKAIDYSRRLDIEPRVDQMAVLIQKAIPADSSGVLFTADPMTGNPWTFKVNATLGLSQDLLDAGAPADQYMLECDTGVVLASQIVEKGRKLIATPSGVEEVDLPADEQTTSSLSDEILQQLGQVALHLDQAFDDRLDIEWAVSEDQIHILQVRPITALPEFFPHDLSDEDQQITWERQHWHNQIDEHKRLVPPLFRNIKVWKKWLRYQPEDVVFSVPTISHELDLNWHRYFPRHPWRSFRDCLPDHQSQVKWLEDNETHQRDLWERAKREVDEEALTGISQVTVGNFRYSGYGWFWGRLT